MHPAFQVGFLIDNFEKPCVLADALVPDCPVVGVSDTFAKLSTLGQFQWALKKRQGFTGCSVHNFWKTNVFQDIALVERLRNIMYEYV